MAQYGDRARDTLLNAAEELFATHGIDAVSNRRITEHAGAANHSAIKYHFGGRDELIAALLTRGREQVDAARTARAEALGDDPTLWELVAAGILPWTEYLGTLPVPSHRARFTYLAMSQPTLGERLRESIENSVQFDRTIVAHPDLAEVPREVLVPRTHILAGLVLRLCAAHEADEEKGTADGDWTSLGYFIVDAATGMLSAPVTPPPSPAP